jgi:hypothetical protein
MTERILDTESVRNHLAFNRQFLEYMALGSNLNLSGQDPSFEKPRNELEQLLWDGLDNDQVEEGPRSGMSIEDIFVRVASQISDPHTTDMDPDK